MNITILSGGGIDWGIVASAAGTCLLALLAWIQLGHIRREARLSRRPVIAIEHASLVWSDEHSRAALRVRLGNDGAGPALNLRIRAGVEFAGEQVVPQGRTEWPTYAEKLVDYLRADPKPRTILIHEASFWPANPYGYSVTVVYEDVYGEEFIAARLIDAED